MIVSRQFLIFLVTGGVAAGVNFSSRFLYSQFFGFSTAVVLAYITGMLTAFALARKYVFQQSIHSQRKSFLYFVLINLIAVLQTWAVSVGLAHHILPKLGVIDFRFEIAHLTGIVIPVFTSYFGHKYLSFR